MKLTLFGHQGRCLPKCRLPKLFSLSVLASALFFSASGPATADEAAGDKGGGGPSGPGGTEHGRLHMRFGPGMMGGPGGFARRGALSSWMGSSMQLTEVLMIPSLTKVQQTKLRDIYIAYRKRTTEMFNTVAQKAAAAQKPSEEDGPDGDVQPPRRGFGMDPEKMKATFQTAFADNIKFSTDVLGVLSAQQRKELRDIGLKTGSPDFFAKLAEEKQKFAEMSAQSSIDKSASKHPPVKKPAGPEPD